MVNNEEIKQPDPWNDGPWNEIASLVLFVVGAVTLVALVSYSSADSSWNNPQNDDQIRNLVGPFGANLADLLYQLFGLTALILPPVLFALGWWQWNEKRSALSRPRILGLLMMFIALTGILTIISGNKQPRAFHLGGAIGHLLVHGELTGLAVFLGPIGAVFALVLIFMIGLVIGTRISIVGTFVQLNPLEGQLERLNQIGGNFWSRRAPRRSPEPPVEEALPGEPSGPIRPERTASRSRRAVIDPAESRAVPAAPTPALPVPPASPVRIETPYPSTTPPEAATTARPEVNRSTARRTTRKTSQINDAPPWLDDGDTTASDFDSGGLNPVRSVADMVATASVVRPEPVDPAEKTRPLKATKTPARPVSSYKLPATDMLTPPAPRSEMAETELLERARQLAEKCSEFNVSGQVMQISPGPVVTTFEFKPDPGVKYSRVTSLVDDLCLGLKAESIRIDRIPGKSTVGIEVPNTNREMIRLREVIESSKFTDNASQLTFAIGKTIDGSNYAADLAKMPHLLIAGATGAGKSVMLNAILVSLLYKSTPDEVKMILVDPKRLELGLYADIPHLLTPIVTDPKRASYALKWAVSEMENRYKHLALFGVRNIDQYNREVCGVGDRARPGRTKDPDAPQPLPFIVVVIDELADLMMVSARDVEESITRLAQMARAVGIHLVLATQRPSVDVITGLIKANFPSRISFRVSSKVDSRTIIDTNGAEQLLGQGDMLFLPPGSSRLIRVHGAYVDEKEVKRICDFVRSQANPNYDEKVVMSDKEVEDGGDGNYTRDEKYDDALRVVLQSGKASTSLLQRTLRIGYGRAASIIDMMHREGIVGPEDGSKPRQVLVKADFLERLHQLNDEKGL
ncbi:MAG: DNA translocase FtsK 4TM domain-containing protein [Blastocatellia bacterium]